MKFSTFQAALGSALVLGAAQPAVAEMHLGHRAAHQHYGKRHAQGSPAADDNNNDVLLSERQPQLDEPLVLANPHLHHRHPQRVDSLPRLFTREGAESSPAAVAERDPNPDEDSPAVAKRAVCSLPDDPDLVAVPGAQNGGFAMAPDVSCTAGKYCPIACASGKLMAQWKPGTSYTYPESMDGGLYCDSNGKVQKAFPSKPYCVDGTGSISAVNRCGDVVSFCQTVLPGDEGMYIPTDVTGTAVLAVPDPSYWASTAAHYYINPPGTSGQDGCIWGTSANPIGNWSPYVAGANADSSGQTFVKIGWNPIFTGSSLAGTKPSFGVKIECSGSDCNGLPCEIGSSNLDDFSVKSADSATGAGGADFCVVTVPSGSKANIVVYNFDGSSSGGSGGSSSSSASASSSSSSSTFSSSSSSSSSAPPPSSSSSSSSSSFSSSSSTSLQPTTSSSSIGISSSSSAPSSSSTELSTSSTFSPSSSSSAPPSSSSFSASSTQSSLTPFLSGSPTGYISSSSSSTSSSAKATTTNQGGIFHENGTTAATANKTGPVATGPTTSLFLPSGTDSATAAATSSKNEGSNHAQGSAALVGLLVALVASLWLY